MNQRIESNIILQTLIPKPRGDGFASIHSSLNKLEKKLTDLTSREWKVKITLDDSELRRLGLRGASTGKSREERDADRAAKQAKEEQRIWDQLAKEDKQRAAEKKRDAERQRREDERVWNKLLAEQAAIDKKREAAAKKAAAEAKKIADQQAAAAKQQAAAASSPPMSSRPGYPVTEARRKGRMTKDGMVYTTTETGEQTNRGRGFISKTTVNESGDIIATDDRMINLAEKRAQAAARVRAEEERIAALAGPMAKEEINRLKRLQYTLDTVKEIRNTVTGEVKRVPTYAKSERSFRGDIETNFVTIDPRTGKIIEDRKIGTGEQSAKRTRSGRALFAREQQRNEAAAGVNLSNLLNEGYQVLKTGSGRTGADPFQEEKIKLVRFYIDQANQQVAETVTAYLKGKRANQFSKDTVAGVPAMKMMKSLQDRDSDDVLKKSANQAYIGTRLKQYEAEGFVRQRDRERFDKSTGSMQKIQEYRRVSGDALRGFTVEIVRANVAAQKLESSLLTGAAASRALGDSLFVSIQKVALWSVATGSVFLFTRGLWAAAAAAADLEHHIVLLARVGRNLGGAFADRYKAAVETTDAILAMTTAIGGNAIESLKAAAIFGRAGQNQREIIESVRVSLLAARIAELDVAEAAELMSSAIYQFNGSARDMAPTLDMLNTLSNNFRVTTGDLMQSISRSGSIIAQQNGRMSELAATTAITASVTSRTGAEIGNAMKTIASQADRIETKRFLFEKLGVSVHDLGGESKSYTQFLLEMSLALETATDAERNLATTQVAGVRQRNIMLAQMNNIVDTIKAENTALIGRNGDNEDRMFGSGFQEFLQTSDTLTSSLGRLQAQALDTSYTLGSGFVNLGKNLSDILSWILSWVSAGNRLTGGMLAQVSIIGIMVGVMRALAATYGITTASITAFVTQLWQQAAAATAASGSVIQLATNMAVASRGFLVAAGVWGAVAGAILLVVDAIGSYAQQAMIADEIERMKIQSAERDIVTEKNRAQAYLNTANAIGTVADGIRDLEVEQKKTGKDNSGTIKSRQAMITGLAAEAGVVRKPGQTPESLQFELIKKQRAAQEAQQRLLESKVGQLRSKAADEGSRLARERQALRESDLIMQGKLAPAKSGQYWSRLWGSQEGVAQPGKAITNAFKVSTGGVLSGLDNKANYGLRGIHLEIAKEIQVIEDAWKDTTKQLKEAEAELKAIKEAQAKIALDPKKYRNAERILFDFTRNSERTIESIESRRRTRNILGGVGGSDLKRTMMELKEVKDASKDAEAALLMLKEVRKVGDGQLETAEKNLIKLLEREKELLWEKFEIEQKIRKEGARTVIAGDSKLRQGAYIIEQQRARGLSGTASSYGDQVAALKMEREALQRDTLAIQKDVSTGKLKDPAQIAAANEKIGENLIRLRELELDYTMSLLEAEKNIAIERKKSADEALRAVGALNEEDKMRVLAQAQYFAKNPNAKISAQDAFTMNGADFNILSRFFGSKIEDISQQKNAFANILNVGRFGISQDLQLGENEIAAARGGRSNEQIIADQRARFMDRARQAGLAQNGGAGWNAVQDMGGFNNGNNIALNIKNDINFGPVLDQIKRVYEVKEAEMVQAMGKTIESIVDRKFRLLKAGVAPKLDGN